MRRHRSPSEALLRPLAESDLWAAHGLSVEIGWPHRPEDWRFIFEIGHGFVACDGIDRVLGSAMWWPFGERFATVGMVLVSPRLQAQGAGKRLMEEVFAAAEGRDLRLNATHAGYRLYESIGFEPIARVFQHQGFAKSVTPLADNTGVRWMTEADWDKLPALDLAAYGADRSRMLKRLRESSFGTICERDGRAVGFALCRPFGRGHIIGPIIAEDDRMAIALSTPHVGVHAGTFLRADTAYGSGDFAHFLEEIGLVAVDHVTTMVRGQNPTSIGEGRIFGVVTQALG